MTADIWQNYLHYKKEVYEPLLPRQLEHNLISEANWVIRSRCQSGLDMGIFVRPGDICYIDFGQAYLNEAGYQHFGLVMTVYSRKALVVPMTSNEKQYKHAYDPRQNPSGKRHLMRIGLIEGMKKPSVLFLNDMKFINTARVIETRAHIDTHELLFLEIKHRLFEIIIGNDKL